MKKLLIGIGLLLGLGSCTPGVAPPIGSEIAGTEYTHGKVVWYDLASPNPELSASFYSTVFGWKVIPYGEGSKMVWVFENEGKPVGLMANYKSKNNSGEWIGAISVDDVASATEMAKSMGAAVLRNPVAVENLGSVSFIEDAQGAHISFIKMANGDPEAGLASINSFLGMELWSNDPNDSKAFYSDIVGFSAEPLPSVSPNYQMMKKDGRNCIGLLPNPAQGVRSHFIPYVRVADVKATIEKARNAGAQILIEPSSEIRGGTAGLFLDPTGAPVAVQLYNP
jgi:predicted enzyme related to lactoylglutathione lyase